MSPTIHPNLVGVDLTAPLRKIAEDHGVTQWEVRLARKAAGVNLSRNTKARKKRTTRPGKLAGADLTRPTRELMDEYGVTRTAVSWMRRTRGIPVPTRTKKPRKSRAKAAPKPVKVPTPKKPAPTREIHVPAPPPMVAEDIVVAALKDELVVCRSAYSAALVVASRLKRPVDELLTVAERLMGRAA